MVVTLHVDGGSLHRSHNDQVYYHTLSKIISKDFYPGTASAGSDFAAKIKRKRIYLEVLEKQTQETKNTTEFV